MPAKQLPQRPDTSDRLTKAVHRFIGWVGSVQSLVVHTLFFAASFATVFFGYSFGDVLLVVTTVVSLEAIYMAIFIQMAVNENTKSLDAVEEDIDEIQEDVEEIQEDVEEIEKDVDEIQKDVDEMEKDVDEIQKDVDEMEKEGSVDISRGDLNKASMLEVEARLVKLLAQLEKMKDGMK